MKAVILAAGVGSRLGHLTAQRPKAGLIVRGRSLFDRTLSALGEAKIRDVYVVSGHAAEVLRREAKPYDGILNLREVWNPKYTVYNNNYSLWLLKEELAGKPFLLLNSDVLFPPAVLQEMVTVPEGCWLAVDEESPLSDEAMKVKAREGIITAIGKNLPIKESAGEYIGIARFDAEGSRYLFRELDLAVREGRYNEWYEHAIDRMLTEVDIHLCPVKGGTWVEIDTIDDLQCAESVAELIDI